MKHLQTAHYMGDDESLDMLGIQAAAWLFKGHPDLLGHLPRCGFLQALQWYNTCLAYLVGLQVCMLILKRNVQDATQLCSTFKIVCW